MRDGGFNLGGEQSGHVIFADHATTGDGVLTGLQIAAQIALTGKPLKELATVMTKLPQVLINVKGVDRSRVGSSEGAGAGVAVAEAELGDTGRVLLRPSGTEPVVRVMVEAGAPRDRRSHRRASGPGGPHGARAGTGRRLSRPIKADMARPHQGAGHRWLRPGEPRGSVLQRRGRGFR